MNFFFSPIPCESFIKNLASEMVSLSVVVLCCFFFRFATVETTSFHDAARLLAGRSLKSESLLRNGGNTKEKRDASCRHTGCDRTRANVPRARVARTTTEVLVRPEPGCGHRSPKRCPLSRV